MSISTINEKDTKNQEIKQLFDKKWYQAEKKIKEKFPEILYGFGYGSGVIQQAGYDFSKEFPQLDYIFVIENQRKWHNDNLYENGMFYSGLPFFWGGRFI